MGSSQACIVWLLALAVTLAGAAAGYPPPDRGVAKDAWPELVGLKSAEAVKVLKASDLVKNVRVWGPSFDVGDKPAPKAPTDRGKPEDVWVYTDQNDEVYEIPRRGLWHPNRVFPGWTNLLGKDLKYAIKTIQNDFFGVTVRYVPDGELNKIKVVFTRDRVFVQFNDKGKVSRIPVVY